MFSVESASSSSSSRRKTTNPEPARYPVGMDNMTSVEDALTNGTLDDRLAKSALRDLEYRFGPGWHLQRRQDEVALLVLGACAARSGGAARSDRSGPDRLSTVIRVCELACDSFGIDLGEQRL